MKRSEWTEGVINDLIARQRASIVALAPTQVAVDQVWSHRIDALEAELDEPPEVRIALLGGTGAGKSTLVNALARAPMLPVSSMKACTSAITELAHRNSGYSAAIEFIDRASWHQELEVIAAEVADQLKVADDQPGAEEFKGIGRAHRDKLRAIYGDVQADAFLASPRVAALSEPDEVRRAFDQGFRHFEHGDGKEFSKELKRYLDSSGDLWPVVRTVRVEGPVPTLVDGVTLVDLPGLNDPNAAREAATKAHLKDAQFVWVVFNMKRALTREVFEFLREEDLLRRLFMDGRTETLSFVGTASDGIDVEHDIDALGLDDESEVVDIVKARNLQVKQVVREQLDDLVREMAAAGSATDADERGLRDMLQRTPVFCVSARDFMQIEGLTRRLGPVIDDVEVTQIPALLAYMDKLVEANGRQAQLKALGVRLKMIGEEMFLSVTNRQAQLTVQVERSDREMEEVRTAAEEAQRFLRDRLKVIQEDLGGTLVNASEILEERLRSSIADARRSLDRVAQQWSNMHWATLKATVRRDGRFTSSRGHHFDLGNDIAGPILSGVAFAWADFFENRATGAVDGAAREIAAASEVFLERFSKECRSNEVARALFDQFGAPMVESTRTLVQGTAAQTSKEIKSRLRDDRAELTDWVQNRITKELEPAFRIAAQEEGTGMKDRMVEALSKHARTSAGSMFDDVQRHVDQLLTELTQYVLAKSRDLSNNVVGKGVELTKLVETQTTEATDAETLRAELEVLGEVAASVVRP